MKKIIVATDFSAEAENALNYAIAAAVDHNFELILFNLHNISVHALNARTSSTSLDELFGKAKKDFEHSSVAIEKKYNIKVATHIASGEFQEELERCFEIHNADMVVMGMANKSLEQELLGNTTTTIIHGLKLPVLAIPLSAKYEGVKNILFACDVEKGVHQQVLEKVKMATNDFAAKLELFYVNDKVTKLEHNASANNLQKIEKGLEGISYSYKNIASDELVTAIEEELETINADLLIMVPYKYGFWGSLVHISKTNVMASGGKVPLLSIPINVV